MTSAAASREVKRAKHGRKILIVQVHNRLVKRVIYPFDEGDSANT